MLPIFKRRSIRLTNESGSLKNHLRNGRQMTNKVNVGDKELIMFNRSVLLDVSHVAKAGDEKKLGTIVVGRHEVSEIPTYGTVVAVSAELAGQVEIGSTVSIAIPGVLRTVDWPGKDEKLRLVSMRMENVDVIVK